MEDMTLLLIYWSFLLAGYVVADRLRKRDLNFYGCSRHSCGQYMFFASLWGLRMGVNKDVTGNLGTIG